jgi:hypothetical protein
MRRVGLAIFLAMLVASSSAHAQVNAEALRSALHDTPRFLWLQAALAGNAGNTNTLTFSGSAFGGLTYEKHLAFARAAADYGEAKGETNVAKWVAHARYNYRVEDWLALETLAQIQHDRFRRLSIRDLYGAGLRFIIHEDKDLEVFAGTTYLLEHEVIGAVPGFGGTNNLWHRSSDFFGFNFNVTELVSASSVIYVQPRFDRPLDFRILSDSLVNFTITKLLAAGVSGTVWYDNRPPQGVHTYDLTIKNTLTIKLF